MDVYNSMTWDYMFKLCSTLVLFLLHFKYVDSWPEGTYGLPMSSSGCPAYLTGTDPISTFEWEEGKRIQKTEQGSRGSNPVHLAGITRAPGETIQQSFCMKTSMNAGGDYHWGKGSYCIYRKHSCPPEFRDGWIYWDDDAPLFLESGVQGVSGVLPDGEYDRNTKIEYCCRSDGSASKPIVLPTGSPFYLIRMGDSCQKVKGMKYEEEWVYWRDEQDVNLNTQKGFYPKSLDRKKFPISYTKLYYCYYTPTESGSSFKVAMLVVYIIAGVAGGIFVLLVLVCIVRNTCGKRFCCKEMEPGENIENCAREEMLARAERPSAPPSETVIEFRPGKPGSEASVECKVEKKEPLPPDEEHDSPQTVQNGNTVHSNLPSDQIPLYQNPDRPVSQPPSYDDVVFQDMHGPPVTTHRMPSRPMRGHNRHRGPRHGGRRGRNSLNQDEDDLYYYDDSD